MGEIKGAVVVRFDEDGEISYHVVGGEAVRLFIVDERCPNDRVYEWTQRIGADEFRQIVREGDEIGHSKDARHAAIAHRIEALQSGKPFLAPVE